MIFINNVFIYDQYDYKAVDWKVVRDATSLYMINMITKM